MDLARHCWPYLRYLLALLGHVGAPHRTQYWELSGRRAARCRSLAERNPSTPSSVPLAGPLLRIHRLPAAVGRHLPLGAPTEKSARLHDLIPIGPLRSGAPMWHNTLQLPLVNLLDHFVASGCFGPPLLGPDVTSPASTGPLQPAQMADSLDRTDHTGHINVFPPFILYLIDRLIN